MGSTSDLSMRAVVLFPLPCSPCRMRTGNGPFGQEGGDGPRHEQDERVVLHIKEGAKLVDAAARRRPRQAPHARRSSEMRRRFVEEGPAVGCHSHDIAVVVGEVQQDPVAELREPQRHRVSNGPVPCARFDEGKDVFAHRRARKSRREVDEKLVEPHTKIARSQAKRFPATPHVDGRVPNARFIDEEVRVLLHEIEQDVGRARVPCAAASSPDKRGRGAAIVRRRRSWRFLRRHTASMRILSGSRGPRGRRLAASSALGLGGLGAIGSPRKSARLPTRAFWVVYFRFEVDFRTLTAQMTEAAHPFRRVAARFLCRWRADEGDDPSGPFVIGQ